MLFNPLLGDVSSLTASELDAKVSELTKKYFIASRAGNGHLCEQILVTIEAFKQELSAKNAAAMRIATSKGDKDLDDLINVNK
jgi:hypothetical protein